MMVPFEKRWRRHWFAMLVGWLAFSILSACAKDDDSNVILTSSSGEITGVLDVDPFPPPVMNQTRVTLTLTDREGNDVTGARIRFDLTMPAMAMPENRADAEEAAPGHYQAQLLFTMAGEWQIDAEVALEGGQEKLTFLLNTQ